MTAAHKITRDDIKAKLSEIQTEATATAEDAKDKMIAVAVTVGAVVLVGVFLLGVRRGRRRNTVITVKRT